MDKPLKIILLASSLEVGGAERQMAIFASAMKERGHDVHVALFRKHGALLSEVSDVPIHNLKKGGRGDFLGFLLRLKRFVREQQPEVIYSFLGVPNLAAVFLKILGCGVPVVWSVRASDVDLKQYGMITRMCYALEALLSRFADHVIVNSNAGKEHALAQGFSSKAMSVVFNGIDTRRFLPDKAKGLWLRDQWCPELGRVVVGVVARLDPMKDHRTFMKAALQVVRKNPDICFVCIGDGPLKAELQEYVDQLGIGDHLVWAGAQIDMPAVYNALDMVCLSSITEGFPNVLGEAMSCDIPCVTTDVGDARFIVGDQGIVVPRRNHLALAEGILALAESVRGKEGLHPRARAEEHYSLDRMVVDTEAILIEVVHGME